MPTVSYSCPMCCGGNCCATLPEVLYATFVAVDSCAAVNGLVLELHRTLDNTWSFFAVVTPVATEGCNVVTLARFICDIESLPCGGSFEITFGADNAGYAATATSCSCSPFEIVFTITLTATEDPSCCLGEITVIITT